MITYKILRADFSVWKHLAYLALAEEAASRDVDSLNPVLFVVPVETSGNAPGKTARIEVYHVFGTKGTVAARVVYYGRVRWSLMRNDNPQALANAAQDWARSHGFTNWTLSYS